MASTEQISAVHKLIDRSTLLKDVDKSELKTYVEGLSEDDLKRVRSHLEKETDVVLKAFEKGVSGLPEEAPFKNLLEELDDFFLTTKKVFLKSQEKDTRAAEGENLEQLLRNL